MFLRQETCALADIPVERFKSWVRRDELPTRYAPIPGVLTGRDQAKESGWTRFSALEVFMIAMQEALFRQIGDFSGVAAETASWVVAMNARAIREILLEKPNYPSSAADQDRWIGYVGALTDSGKEKKVSSNISGSLDDVLKAIRDSRDRHGRLLLVNSDAVLRGVQARAKRELKIDFIASALASLSD